MVKLKIVCDFLNKSQFENHYLLTKIIKTFFVIFAVCKHPNCLLFSKHLTQNTFLLNQDIITKTKKEESNY